MANPPSLFLCLRDFEAGGAQQAMLNLASGLADAGVRVRFVVWREKGPLRGLLRPDIPLDVLGCDTVPGAVFALRALIRHHRPDAVLSGLLKPNLASALAGRLAGVPVRVVVVEHSHLPSYLAGKGRVARWLCRAVLHLTHACAGGVASVSRAAADAAAAVTGMPAQRVAAVYNPVITPAIAERLATLAPHPADGPVVLFVGRLIASKGVAELIDAFRHMPGHADARLWIIGDGPERAILQARAQPLGGRVQFWGHVTDPWPYYKAAAVLVLPSHHESFGNALVEAMACGTPVIAANCPVGPHEILDGGTYGTLVPVGDVDALTRALAAQLSTPGSADDAARLRKRAADFTVEASVQGYWPLLFEGVPCPVLPSGFRL